MELVDGETLADRLVRGPFPLDEALDVAGQVAAALEAAHLKGIVHRDLKPANVKITPAGAVKVLDFGIAKVLADPAHDDVTLSVTGPAVVLGTPAYMAPEQAQGRSADTRVDVWAFGVVLYEMVTGERPFRRESLQDTPRSFAPMTRSGIAFRRRCDRCCAPASNRIRASGCVTSPIIGSCWRHPRSAPARVRRSPAAVVVDRNRGTCRPDSRVRRREVAHSGPLAVQRRRHRFDFRPCCRPA